jgi:alpha-L-rhamnosidase
MTLTYLAYENLRIASHAWTAWPGYLFLKYISGIQPTSGGFATFDVRPETGGRTFAEGTVPTVRGPITTRWEKNGKGAFLLSVVGHTGATWEPHGNTMGTSP